MACGAQDIKNTIMEHLDIADGGTTEDGLFTLLEVECLGACSNAPMIQINDDFFEDLTVESTLQLLDDLKAGKPVKVGPQVDRNRAMNSAGKTTLIEPPMGPYAPALDA